MPSNAFVLIVLGLTVGQVVGQAQDFTLKRFGSVPVSDSEVAQIEELAGGTSKRLWLLRTPNPSQGARISYAFLEPDAFGKRVLRGRVMRLRADEPPNVPIRSPWKLAESHSYAYIPTTGRLQGDISEHAIDWPFIVQGEFDDDTLISIVEFIRSLPPIPVPAFLKSVPPVPIRAIARRDDAIVVGLRPIEEAMGHAVWLVRKDGRWVITRSETSVV